MALFLRDQGMCKLRVKTSTPVKALQMLCLNWVCASAKETLRTFAPDLLARCKPGLLCLAFILTSVAQAGGDTPVNAKKAAWESKTVSAAEKTTESAFNNTPSGSMTGTSVSHPPAVTPKEKMLNQVRQWISQSKGGQPQGVQLAPLDPRLQVMPCDRALWIDHPFASQETVRVRCPSVSGSSEQNISAAPVWQLYLRVLAVGSVTANASGGEGNAATAFSKIVVAKQLLQRGTVLTPDLIQEVDAPASVSGSNDPAQLTSLKDALMAELVRDVPSGSPLRTYDIRRAILVKMGQQVMMTVGNGVDYQIRVRAEALQDGHMGDQVKLKNTESGKNMSGVVTGLNEVKGL